jgi:arsenate reductase
MAEGFANHYGGDVLIAASAGLSPVPMIAPDTVEAMQEMGVDISKHIPTRYEPMAVSYYDIVVNISGFRLPGKPPKELIEWKVEDPFLQPREVYRRVRSDLENRVMQLILKLRKAQKS